MPDDKIEIERQKIVTMRKEALENLEREKQEVISSYYKKNTALKLELIDLQNKIDNIEDIFKKSLGSKIADLERKERELESDMAAFVSDKNELVVDRNKFLTEEKAFRLWSGKERSSIKVMREELSSSLHDAKAENNRINTNISKNSAILEEIKNQQAVLDNTVKNLDDAKGEIEANKSEATLIKAKAEAMLQDAQRIRDEAESIKELSLKDLASLGPEKENAVKLIQESKDAVMILESQKKEVSSLIKESDDKIQQIAREREKNVNDAINNKAKETLNLEKDRTLTEREKSVKVLIDNLSKEDGKDGKDNG